MMKSYLSFPALEEDKKNLKNNIMDNKKDENHYTKEYSLKEKFIMEKMAPYYLDFFKEANLTCPMFVDSSDFRATKIITISCDITINAGQSCGILFDPFDSYNPAQKWIFGSSVETVPLTSFKTKLNSYCSYKVVVASAKLKQISILAMNDGFGTVFDAVLAPSSFDPRTQGQNPLNINIAERFKKDTIDGRIGLKGFILGNPYSEWINVGNPQPIINPTLFPSGEYHQNFNPGSIFSLGNEGIAPTFTYKGVSVIPDITDNYAILNSAADRMFTNYDTFMSNVKKGMKLWIKITQPTQQTSFKFVYKVALEVIPGTDLSEDVMTYAPPFNYQTQRIFSTIYNNFSCLKTLDEPKIEIGTTNKEFKMDPNLSYASSDLNTDLIKQIFIRNKKVIQKNDVPNQGEPLPDYLKKAVEFIGENIGKINSTADYQRYLRNSTFEAPDTNYQYFPTITDKLVQNAVLCIKKGEYADQMMEIQLADVNNELYTVKVFYNPEDLNQVEDYKSYIAKIIMALNIKYYSQFKYNFTLRFFAPKKIEDRSYGSALAMALMNAPCGQLSTGVIQINDETTELSFQPMKLDMIQAKCTVATSLCPLIAPYEESNSNLYMVSGLMEEIESNRLYTHSSFIEFIFFSYVSPSLKNCKQTPAHKFINDINLLLSNLKVTNSRLFLYLQNFAQIPVIQQFLLAPQNKDKINLPATAYEKCNYKRYNRYIFYGKTREKYVDIQELLTRQPYFLQTNKIPHFYYKEELYVYKPIAISALPKHVRRLTTADVLQRSDILEKSLEKITIDEMKDILKKKLNQDENTNFLNIEMQNFQNKPNNKVMTDLNYDKLILQKASNFGMEANKAIKRLKEITESVRKALVNIPTGQGSYISFPQLAPYFGIPTKIHTQLVDTVKYLYPVLYLEKLTSLVPEQELKKALVDSGIAEDKLTKPNGPTNWNSILKGINQTDSYILQVKKMTDEYNDNPNSETNSNILNQNTGSMRIQPRNTMNLREEEIYRNQITSNTPNEENIDEIDMNEEMINNILNQNS